MDENRTLDEIDLSILRALQENARITMGELSDRVGLSKTPCLERIKKLRKSGHIEGYSARLDPDKLGCGHITFVQVSLSDTSSKALLEFNRAIADIPEVQACHMIAGGFDYLLKVRTHDITDYRSVLGNAISNLPYVQ